MKAIQSLKDRLGSNMRESVGPHRPEGGMTLPIPSVGQVGQDRHRGTAKIKDALAIEVDRIVPDPDQPRKEFDPIKLAELEHDLREFGQIQPCTVRYDASIDRYIIVAGERRYRAATKIGMPTLACIVDNRDLTPLRRAEIQLIENISRDDLKTVERANAYKKLLDGHGFTLRELAEHVGRSTSAIHGDLSVLKLPEDIQAQVSAGEVPRSTAIEAAKIDDLDEQREVIELAKSGKMNKEAVTRMVRERKPRSPGEQGPKPKGRGGKAKPVKLPTSRIVKNLPHGLKLTIEGRKGFDLPAMVEALEAALEDVRGQVEAMVDGGA